MGRISLMIKIRQGQGRWRVPARLAPIKGGHRAGGAMELNRVLCTRRAEGVGSGRIVGGRAEEWKGIALAWTGRTKTCHLSSANDLDTIEGGSGVL